MTNLFSHVLNMSLTASVVILCVLAARFLLRGAPKVFSYLLWAAVLFRLLCPVSLSAPVSLLEFLKPQVTQSGTLTSQVTLVPVEVVHVLQAPAEPVSPESPTPSQAAPANASIPDLRTAAAWVWLAVAAAMALYSAAAYWRLRRRLSGARHYRGEIYLSERIGTAFVLGIFLPKIYLPVDTPKEERRFIIAHERCHIRRGDHIIKLLAYGALCLHWFNPLVWLAFVLAGKDMEMSCDEAVIRHFGPNIRAQYAASLLRLATGGSFVSGTPLSFGGGDTKGRILNMSKWKQPRLWVSVLCALVSAAILAACAGNPQKAEQDPAVLAGTTSPSAETAAAETAAVPTTAAPPDETVLPAGTPLHYEDRFSSSDGTVDYEMIIDTSLDPGELPVLEAQPHYVTAGESQRVAYAIFGADAQFWEGKPILSQYIYDQDELQSRIDRWSGYTTAEACATLWGPDRNDSAQTAELVRSFVEEYKQLKLENRNDYPNVPCKWEMKNEAYYYETGEIDTAALSGYNNGIVAQVQADGLPYGFSASVRDAADFKISMISVYLDPGVSPAGLDERYYTAKVCRTAEPSQEQVAALQAKAESILDRMDMGPWQIDQCTVNINDTYGTTEYFVSIRAMPVLEGFPAIALGPLHGSINQRTPGAGPDNYYASHVAFTFAPGGELLSFSLTSPMDITATISQPAPTMDPGELMALARQSLEGKNIRHYISDFYVGIEHGSVRITGAKRGLTRVRVEQTDATYRYIPTFILTGDVEAVSSQTGNTLPVSQSEPILALNALTGEILPII